MTKRTAILHAATHAFAIKGFRETSTTDLAEMTGVAEGTVFYHFGNKEKLFLAVLDHVRREFEHAFADYLERVEVGTGLEMLEQASAFYLRLADDKRELFQLLHRTEAYELSRGNQQCRDELEKIFECLVSVFEGALERGRADGSIAASATPRTALLIFSMVDGLVRLRDTGLYEPGAVFPELMRACRRLVALGAESG
jgi:AcrR family transcriptional regulator